MHAGATQYRACRRVKLPVSQRFTSLGEDSWRLFVFLILVDCSQQVYAAVGRVCNTNPVRFGLHKRGSGEHSRTSAERYRNRSLRLFRSLHNRRNTPERRSMRPAEQDRTLRPRDPRFRPRLRSSRWRRARPPLWCRLPETPIKQGVELSCGFQFRSLPVFRPSRSASLTLPQ